MAQSTQELRRSIEGTRSHLGDTLDSIGDRMSVRRVVERRRERMRARVHSMRGAVMGTGERVQHAVQSGAQTATEQMESAATAVGHEVGAMPERVVSGTQGYPLIAGVVAFGAGLLAAIAVPATEAEQRAAANLEDTLQPVKDRAVEVGQEVRSAVEASAQDATEELKTKASDAAHHIKDDVQDAAARTTEDARSAAQEVKDTRTY